MKYTPKILRIFIPPSFLYKHFWQPLSTIISKIRHFFNPLPPLSVYVLNGRPLTDSPISVTLALKNVTVKTNDIRLKPMHYWSISWKKFDMFTRVLEVSIVKVAWYCISNSKGLVKRGNRGFRCGKFGFAPLHHSNNASRWLVDNDVNDEMLMSIG